MKPETSDDKARMSVKEWAANVLPTVEHHLDRAKEIKDHIDHPNATARANPSAQGTKRYQGRLTSGAGQPDRARSQLAMVEPGRLVQRLQ